MRVSTSAKNGMNHNRTGRRGSAVRGGVLAVSAAALGTASSVFGQVQTPLAISGWNSNQILSGGSNTTTSAFDAYNDYALYANNALDAPSGAGLPTANNQIFTSQYNSNTTFQFQPYTGNDALELVTAGNANYGPGGSSNPVITQATLTLNNPGTYSNLSFLNADANGASTISYTLNFAGGVSAPAQTFSGVDWYGSGNVALNNIGRAYLPYYYLLQYSAAYAQYVYSTGTNPQLFETDITVPSQYQSQTLDSITFSMSSPGGSEWNLFAISGTATAFPSYLYTGTDPTTPGSFDNGITSNFQLSGGAASNVPFANGCNAVFDDTAPGPHVVSVGSGGVSPVEVLFNNSNTSYTLTGPGSITGNGGLAVNGGGIVTITNSNSYTGVTSVGAGTLNLNSGAQIASTAIAVSGGALNLNSGASVAASTITVSGGTFNLNSGGTLTASAATVNVSSGATFNIGNGAVLSATSLSLINTGTINSSVSALAPVSLAGTGVVNLNGTALTLPNTTFTGTIGGTSGSVIFPGTATFAGSLGGGIAVSKTVGGFETLTGSNTYTGGTSVTAGTLNIPTRSSLGSGPVTLNGGTLRLGSAAGAGTLEQVVSGLSTSDFTTNGSNGISGSTLTLTTGGGQTTSAFFNTPVSISNGFVATYSYTVTSQYLLTGSYGFAADGMTFIAQNIGLNAIGGGGGLLGYGGIGSNSAGIATNTFEYTGAGNAFASGGVVPSSFSTSDSDLTNLEYETSPTTFNVTVTYNASAQTMTMVTVDSAGTFTQTFASGSLPSLVGGNTAYIGFTGSAGGSYAEATVSNFTFSAYEQVPTSIANNVIAAPSTSSVIQIPVSAGNTQVSIGSLSINTGALVQLSAVSSDGSATHCVMSMTGLSVAGSTGHWTGTLDLTNNALDVQNGSTTVLAAVTSQVKQGYAGGTWQGSGGIVSSTAAADTAHLTAVGVILNDSNQSGGGVALYGAGGSISSTFDGAAAALDDVLVKYTYYGDVNLDGAVDGSDYSVIDVSFASEHLTGVPVSGWGNGDFNYDGVVNGSDYTLIDNAFNQQGSSLGVNPLAQIASQVGGSAVPEPATLSVLAMGTTALLSRRRRTGPQ